MPTTPPATAATRPDEGSISSSRPVGGAADPVELPNGPVPRLLLGLCRRGPAHEPVMVHGGLALYRWRGLDGDQGEVQLRTPEHPDYTERDALATAALARAPVEDRS